MKFLMWWLAVFIGLCFADYNGLKWGVSKDSVEKKYAELEKFDSKKVNIVAYKQVIEDDDEGPSERRFYFYKDSLLLVEVVYLYPEGDYLFAVLKNIADLYGKDFKEDVETSYVPEGYIKRTFWEWNGKVTDVLVVTRESYNFYGMMIAQTVVVTYMSHKLTDKVYKENRQRMRAKVEM
jgi:hypothetical protein